ncbi:MAG: pyruvate formate lyase-activating protein [Ruminococcaceae bacterium]|nr:pyruvate formate lyase-activating protein [Oscillospiraceae bacterium]
MNEKAYTGKIHSLQTLGLVDGPGVRFVVFFQGCPLRCGCCHNPDTWDLKDGKEITAEELAEKATHYRTYFGHDGGVTVSGGEPLMQPGFAERFFRLCHENGLNTCMDTSGCFWNEEINSLLSHTDRVLLDIKYTNEEDYRQHVGCELSKVLFFLQKLDEKKIPTTIRQVIIPTINDNEDNIRALAKIVNKHDCIDKIELLPFRKICQVKYDSLSRPFPFAHIPEPSEELMDKLNALIKEETHLEKKEKTLC